MKLDKMIRTGITMILTHKFAYIIGGLSAFFLTINTFMIAIGVLIILDFIFGIMAAKKKGEKINSKRMSDSIVKILVYQLLIISAQIVHLYLVPEWLPLLGITLAFLGLVEFFSISESFTTITGKNFIKFIREYIKGKLKSGNLPTIEDLNKNK